MTGRRRALRLGVGLALLGSGVALMVRSGLGLGPWDVLHEGLAEHTGVSFGAVVVAVGAVVLALWVPLRQRIGSGTVANALAVGVVVDVVLAIVPSASSTALGWVELGAGIVAMALGTGLYIGAGLGPGPRDGLMTGLAARGGSIRSVRAGIELSVLAAGWALGGTVGIGTLAYAVAIGPLVQMTMGWFGPEPGAGLRPAPLSTGTGRTCRGPREPPRGRRPGRR